jgi:hypothetical protein
VPKEVFTSTKEENLLHLNSTLNRTQTTKFSKRAFCTRKSRERSFVPQERTIEKTTGTDLQWDFYARCISSDKQHFTNKNSEYGLDGN